MKRRSGLRHTLWVVLCVGGEQDEWRRPRRGWRLGRVSEGGLEERLPSGIALLRVPITQPEVLA